MTRPLVVAFVLFTACGDDGGSTYVGPAVPQALVVSGDFAMTGLMSKLDLTTMDVAQNIGGAGAVSGDPVIRRVDDRVYVINRQPGNSVTVFDATTLGFLDQFGTGEGSNPQDVARVGDNLYVPSMGTAGVVKIDKTGKTTTIDLSSLDPDGKPDCISAIAVDKKVYVACDMLDENYTARGNGVVAVLDATTDMVTKMVELPARNPYNFMMRADNAFGGDILIPLLPSFSDYSSGCVARMTTGSSPTVSCATGLSNMQIGGTVIHMDLAPDGKKLWMAVGTNTPDFMNPTGTLKSFDIASSAVTAVSPSTQMIQDVATCSDGTVVASDGTFTGSGLRVYSGTTEKTSAPLAFGLPPTFGNAITCYGGE